MYYNIKGSGNAQWQMDKKLQMILVLKSNMHSIEGPDIKSHGTLIMGYMDILNKHCKQGISKDNSSFYI